MKLWTWNLLAMLGVGTALSAVSAAFGADGELKVGDKAPAFTAVGTDGKMYSLDQFKGKQGVVIAWFPKAKTGGCTKECKSLRENGTLLKPLNVAYFTASIDTPAYNKEFATELGLDYPILSFSEDGAKAYGVVHEGRKNPERWTFYIDKGGVIRAIDKKINVTSAGADVASKIKELGLNGN